MSEINDTTPETATPTPAPATPDNPVIARLKGLGVADDMARAISEKLADAVGDLAYLTVDHLTGIGMKPGTAGKLIEDLRPAKSEPVAMAAQTAAGAAVSTVSFDAVLPSVLADKAWLDALRAGGVLKVDESTVMSAIRAALADRFGLYEVPQRLVEEIERYVDTTEEQVGPEFFKLRRLLTQRSYGDLFDALEGMDGRFVTEGRKKELLRRINDHLWPSIIAFNNQLQAWQQSWMQGAANPMMMMAGMLGGNGVMPPGLMQPPDTGVLRDAAEKVADDVNRVFRGTGVQITAALAYEAQQITETMKNPRLPAMIGVGNRELVLKKLGISVPATYTRMEQGVTRFALSILQVKDQAGGQEELRFFSALCMLGAQIPWGELSVARDNGRRPTPLGGGTPTGGHKLC